MSRSFRVSPNKCTFPDSSPARLDRDICLTDRSFFEQNNYTKKLIIMQGKGIPANKFKEEKP